MDRDAPRPTRIAFTVALAGVSLCAAWWFSPLHARAAPAAPDAGTALVHDQGRVVVPDGSPLRRTVAVAPVTEQDIDAHFALPAIVEADPARLVKVLPPAAGLITRVERHLGEAVSAGDVLFHLSAADVAQALGDAEKARTALALARSAFDRQLDLHADGIAATRELEQARADVDSAASERTRAEARLAQLGVAAGGSAAAGRDLAVRSPIGGRIVELNAATGATWNDPTAALMTVADLSTVFVTASADERDLGAVFVGQTAEVTLDAWPGESRPGTVRQIADVVDPDTRRVKVRLAFDNRDGRLKPGMFATASFVARRHRGLLVPIGAVVQSGFYARVFVESQPWRFEPRVVRLGARVGDRIEIAAGLAANERIVVRDGLLLND